VLKLRQSPHLPEQNLAGTAEEHLRQVLTEVPFLTLTNSAPNADRPGGPDFTVQLDTAGDRWLLVCEVKRLSQPLQVRAAAYDLRHHLLSLPNSKAYGILIAPYLSEESIAVLRKESLGYLDFAGNCFLSFGSVFIERRGAPNPAIRRRGLREIFAPKASRVLRILLQDPDQPWRVIDLANSAGVSLGEVSNVRRALLNREWAYVDAGGLKLKDPSVVLDAWRTEYKAPVAEEKHYYTLLHGEALDYATRQALATADADLHLLLALFSAARWLAPFARAPGHFFYADAAGEERLKSALQLDTVDRGANVTVIRPKDNSVFIGRKQVANDLWSTGPLQTYLDLWSAGERGQEAADHLRRQLLDTAWRTLS
jgi:Transcriptional regulator, AbiEi antitoxin, Type IV TA system